MKCFEVYKPVEEGVHDPHIFKAIFMAGAPGSGKTTVRQELLAHTGLKALDIDRWWEYFNLYKKDLSKDYPDYWKLVQAQRRNYITGRLGMVIDGTAKDLSKITKTKRVLERIGYDTAMIFVNTDLQTAIDRVNARQAKTGRPVDQQRVRDNWNVTQQNLGHLQNLFAGNFFIVDNTDVETDYNQIEKRLNAFLNKKPTNPAATEWIRDQLNNRASS